MSDLVRRLEDMSPDGQLQVCQQDDGDMIIGIFARDSGGKHRRVDVEFCTYSGGGKSPETLKALRNLMIAIKTDNEQEPSRDADSTPAHREREDSNEQR